MLEQDNPFLLPLHAADTTPDADNQDAASQVDLDDIRRMLNVSVPSPLDAHLHAVVSALPIIVFELDAGGCFTLAEGKSLELMGNMPGQLIGQSFMDVLTFNSDSDPAVAGHLRRALAGQSAVFLSTTRGRTWENHWTPRLNEHGAPSGMIGVSYDITDRVDIGQRLLDYAVALETKASELQEANASLAEANSRLETMANEDALTGLHNSRFFRERLPEEVRRARRQSVDLSLIMLDLDSFKEYNDAFGHPAGDGVMRIVASVLMEHTRETDYVCRYGGEEFALILPATGRDGAMIVAERLRASLEGAAWPERVVTASIGVSSLSPSISDPADLLMCADQAMYRSKANGRNCVTHNGPSLLGTE